MKQKRLSPQEYAIRYRLGSLGGASTEGLLGRVIRGKQPSDFETLSDDPSRLLILMTDPQGLSLLPGTPGFTTLLNIGWDVPYAIQKVQDGYQMKLVVCREGGKARLATWDNVVDLVGQAYPEIAERLKRHLPALKKTPFAEIESQYGHDMSVVDRDGDINPAYMTFDRYKLVADTVVNARAFLYFTVHLRELYAGDGFTYDNNGVKGVREYMALNCKISELEDAEVIDFSVDLPAACTLPKSRILGAKLGPPSYFNPDDVGRRYQPRLDLVSLEASMANLRPAALDKEQVVLVIIDGQDDFVMPEIRALDGTVIQRAGRLRVAGAVDDMLRLILFIYQYADRISAVVITLDQHIPWQIFFGRWWKDRAGNHPAPYTAILDEAVQAGEWIPQLETAWSRAYPGKLAKTGQTPLIIWPDHCIIGTEGAALVPALAEAIHWLCVARGIQPMYLFKGTVPQTEHYGPFCPCVEVPGNVHGGLNAPMLDVIAGNYHRILVSGEAEDFCVREGMRQMLKYFGIKHPDAIKKTGFMIDCTSPVFATKVEENKKVLQDMADQGVIITTTTELLAA